MEIRRATPDDATVLLRFVHELATYEREPDAVEVTEEVLRGQLGEASPPFECLIAEDRIEGRMEPLGFALFFHTYSTWRGKRGVFLEDLWVTPSARRRGVGRALLVELARLARDRDCARLEWSVLDWNQLAIDFYRGVHATPMTDWTRWRLDGDALDALVGS